MARYKDYNYDQTKMIPLRFADQIQPGTFEYTLMSTTLLKVPKSAT